MCPTWPLSAPGQPHPKESWCALCNAPCSAHHTGQAVVQLPSQRLARLLNDTQLTCDLQAALYGIGALQQGVWYFSFGANLSSQKLTGARGITPLESVPGRLDGWRLTFNHRVRPRPQGFLVLCRCPNAIEPAHLVPLRTVRWAVQGAMGNIMQDAGAAVHGALYRLQPMDLARLTNMEHEYRRVGLVMSAEVLQPLSTKQLTRTCGIACMLVANSACRHHASLENEGH